MKSNETLSRLREICDVAHAITKEDKDYLKREAKRAGVEISACNDCPNKWADLAVQLYRKLKADEKPDSGEHYQLKEGVDVIFGGVRVNEATITDELAAKLLARGFARKWFAVIPESNAD